MDAVVHLQQQAGNRAVTASLAGGAPAVQRALIPAGATGAGRVPKGERKSLVRMLKGNGFDDTAVAKATTRDEWGEDLQKQFEAVRAVDDDFLNYNGSEPWQQRKRKALKTQLAAEYHRLLDLATAFREQAEDEYEQAVATAADALVAKGPTPGKKQFFKSDQNWTTFRDRDLPAHAAPYGGFVTLFVFQENVFKRANQSLKPVKPAPPGLSPAEQTQLDAEKAAVNAQLTLWKTKPANAPGCNAQGTWGTSFGGAGTGFAATRLSGAVWRKLRQWWMGKTGAYVTDSETTNFSLKMWRDVGGANLSPTLNYHVDVG